MIKKKKTSPERAHRGNIPQHNQSHIYDKPTANSTPKAEGVISKIKNRTMVPIFTTSFKIVLEVLVPTIGEKKK